MLGGSRLEEYKDLPVDVRDEVKRLVGMIGCPKRVRREVQREIFSRLAEVLRDCASPEETQVRTEELMSQFGNPEQLAILCRRAAKRTRPLWRRLIGRVRLAIFLLVVIASTYTTLFVTGKPVVTYEYLVKLNETNRPDGPTTSNACPYYERACSLLVEPNEYLKETSAFKKDGAYEFQGFAAMDNRERKTLVQWVAANESAWDYYRRGSRKRWYYKPYLRDPNRPTAPTLIDIMIDPWLAQLKDLARIGTWKARMDARDGRFAEAIDHCMVVARTGTHLQAQVSLIAQLLGAGTGAMARSELLRTVSVDGFPEGMSGNVQSQIADLYEGAYPSVSFEGERLMVLDSVQHTFTSGGFGGGHLIPGQVTPFVTAALELPEGRRTTIFQRVVLWPMDVGISMIHARRDKTVAKIHETYNEVDERSKLSPCERRARSIGDWRELADSISIYRYGLVQMLLPNESRVSELPFRLRAEHEATLIVLALKRSRTEKGNYPSDLESLVRMGFLPSVPSDPYSDGPLIYKRCDDDFVLYSVGPDFVDGGGRGGVDDEGATRLWADNGDRVFWPFRDAVE